MKQDINGVPLRDYFAAYALVGLLSMPCENHNDEAIADIAYRLADDMMEARKND